MTLAIKVIRFPNKENTPNAQNSLFNVNITKNTQLRSYLCKYFEQFIVRNETISVDVNLAKRFQQILFRCLRHLIKN